MEWGEDLKEWQGFKVGERVRVKPKDQTRKGGAIGVISRIVATRSFPFVVIGLDEDEYGMVFRADELEHLCEEFNERHKINGPMFTNEDIQMFRWDLQSIKPDVLWNWLQNS